MDVVQVLDMKMKKIVAPLGLIFLAACSTTPAGTEGHIDPDKLEKVMKAHAGDFTACYEKAPGHQPGLAETRFRVNSSGKVIVATIQMSTLQNPEIESCLLEQIRALSFASPTGGDEAQVQYPFKFPAHAHK